jgi:hypothetical protein
VLSGVVHGTWRLGDRCADSRDYVIHHDRELRDHGYRRLGSDYSDDGGQRHGERKLYRGGNLAVFDCAGCFCDIDGDDCLDERLFGQYYCDIMYSDFVSVWRVGPAKLLKWQPDGDAEFHNNERDGDGNRGYNGSEHE